MEEVKKSETTTLHKAHAYPSQESLHEVHSPLTLQFIQLSLTSTAIWGGKTSRGQFQLAFCAIWVEQVQTESSATQPAVPAD